MKKFLVYFSVTCLLAFILIIWKTQVNADTTTTANTLTTLSTQISDTFSPEKSVQHNQTTQPLVRDARKQIGVTTSYDPAYVSLKFPNGDVPIHKGVCTDVVIRAYRGQGKDLQKLVNVDMKKKWSAYPKIWGLKKTDSNIDHRRVPNLQVFFKRHGKSLPVTQNKSDYKAGDIVTWMVGGKLPHIGIVSDRKSLSGVPLIIHNIGRGTQEENMLFDYKITGHYRY